MEKGHSEKASCTAGSILCTRGESTTTIDTERNTGACEDFESCWNESLESKSRYSQTAAKKLTNLYA